MIFPWSVLPKSCVLPVVDLVDLVFEDEEKDLEEDTSIKKDPSMDEEAPITELKPMEKDSSQDSSDDSY